MPLRTAEQYIASLRDKRRVFFRGQPVPDVTTHPVIGGRGAACRNRLSHGRGSADAGSRRGQ